MPMRLTLEAERLDRVSFPELHDRLLPVGPAADGAAHAAGLAPLLCGPDTGDLHSPELLDGLADRRLRGIGVYFERVLAALLIGHRALLGDDRADNGLIQRWHCLRPLLLRLRRAAGGLLRRLLGGALLDGGLPVGGQLGPRLRGLALRRRGTLLRRA